MLTLSSRYRLFFLPIRVNVSRASNHGEERAWNEIKRIGKFCVIEEGLNIRKEKRKFFENSYATKKHHPLATPDYFRGVVSPVRMLASFSFAFSFVSQRILSKNSFSLGRTKKSTRARIEGRRGKSRGK